ncbi:hypothetical protein B0T10DRAFT_457589 [Thelonectria olida]|uniref:Uncharacterized protein n=1 Tax=Thelonectria olida TaxID=1576542 RepID=A0A9P9APM4_9HYPO|nr:hypothetical protein B0T10DRAFT_457589 [Thelonectria olida]
MHAMLALQLVALAIVSLAAAQAEPFQVRRNHHHHHHQQEELSRTELITPFLYLFVQRERANVQGQVRTTASVYGKSTTQTNRGSSKACFGLSSRDWLWTGRQRMGDGDGLWASMDNFETCVTRFNTAQSRFPWINTRHWDTSLKRPSRGDEFQLHRHLSLRQLTRLISGKTLDMTQGNLFKPLPDTAHRDFCRI